MNRAQRWLSISYLAFLCLIATWVVTIAYYDGSVEGITATCFLIFNFVYIFTYGFGKGRAIEIES